jgi:5-(carboxyamino)imidazole ribonucleotide mutase
MAIGKPGAANAAVYAAKILAARDPKLRERLRMWKKARSEEVMEQEIP